MVVVGVIKKSVIGFILMKHADSKPSVVYALIEDIDLGYHVLDLFYDKSDAEIALENKFKECTYAQKTCRIVW